MLRGFYTAASGMMAQQRQVDMNSNNMANANTPGFKTDQASLRAFPEMLLSRMEGGGFNKQTNRGSVGSINTGVYMQEGTPLMKQGDLRETGTFTDVALWNKSMPVNPDTNELGTVLFQVEANGETAYTRNGNFAIDGQGYLTTNQGNYVINEGGGRIRIPSDSFELGNNGEIVVNGNVVGQLGIAYSAKPSDLSKVGGGLFTTAEGEGALPLANGNQGEEFSFKQGFVERSNVDPQQTMTNMMNSYRMFEMNQKVLKAFDQSLQKTVTEIGRVR